MFPEYMKGYPQELPDNINWPPLMNTEGGGMFCMIGVGEVGQVPATVDIETIKDIKEI